MRQSLCVFTLLSSAFFCADEVRAYEYFVTDLGTLGGGGSFGSGINSSGQVAGNAFTPQNLPSFPQHAFLWTPTLPGGTSGTMLDLGTLGGTNSFGAAINDKAQVTGRSETNGAGEHAFLYDGTMHDLGTLGGTFSDASGINASGQVTGRSSPSASSLPFHAYLYDGTMHDIGTLGGNNSEGLAINAAGHVTGDSDTSVPNVVHAFSYDGMMHDLGTLGGPTSVGLGINSSEHVTGWSILAGGESHAFLYDGTMHDLGVAGENSSGNGINSSGQVVGDFFRVTIPPSATPEHAFLYSNAVGMVDLNSLIDPQSGWELTSAQAINDAGQITGYGQIGGQQHAFLLTPVAEPTSLVLALFALVGFGAGARSPQFLHRMQRCAARRN
jgi:probable HAF family extracellular repeat protein